VHHGEAEGLFDPASGGAILPEVAPLPGEAIVEKWLPNAFAGTELQGRLSDLRRPSLLLAGFMTHMCVSATARAALDLGHQVTIAADATATRALPDVFGGADLSAAQVHRAALAELADRFAAVLPSADIAD